MIGALSGISLSIINPKASSGRARDGVRFANVKSIAEAIESYRQMEGKYPPTADAQTATSQLRTVYLKKWPDPLTDDGKIDAAWNYVYFSDGTNFLVYAPNSIGGCYKYQSDLAKVKTCPLAECKSELSPAANCK